MTCPNCGSPDATRALFKIKCPNPACVHFSGDHRVPSAATAARSGVTSGPARRPTPAEDQLDMPVEPDNTIEPANPPPAPEPRTAQPVARNSWRKAAGVALGLLGVVLMVGCVVSKEYGALAKALVMTYVGVSMYRNPAPQAPPARAPLSRGFLWTIAILFGLILLVIAVSLIA